MTVARLIAIGFIFACVTVAWFILGGSIVVRTSNLGSSIAPQVRELWGPPMNQSAPFVWYKTLDKGAGEEPMQLDSSDIKADLHLDYRQKGLLWFSTYVVDFDSRYLLTNSLDQPIQTRIQFRFPALNTLYDNFIFQVNNKSVVPGRELTDGVIHRVTLEPGETANIHIAYRSRGTDTWLYSFGPSISNVKNFTMTVNTDFKEFDFPPQTVSSMTKQATDKGWNLQWHFDSLLAAFNIGVEMPKKTQPGPLASRMSFFAPVSLLFFFTVLVIIGAVRGQNLHPMHYFFLGAAFFSFHLLFAYLADQIAVELAFIIAAIVSLALVVSYVGRMANWRFALREVGIAQCLFLILFSYAFFYEGYTGLVITIGAIITLAILMQVTARVDWEQVFRGKKAKELVTGGG